MKTQTFKRWLPAILGSTLVGLLIIGLTIVSPALAQGPGMMGGSSYNSNGYGSGYGNMMGGASGYGYGDMMGYGSTFTGTMPFGYGDMMGNGGGYGSMMGGGMMGGFSGMMNNFGGFGNMMGNGIFWSGLFKPDPISLSDATSAVETYIAGLGDSNLGVGEVMIFDNHAYAEIVETDSGIGVAEVLIDPVTGSVSPEMGPNLMWNQKYGMMGGFGSMMGGFGFGSMSGNVGAPGSMMDDTLSAGTASTDMPVSATDAVKIAQAYLDNYVPGNLTVEDNADPFYGYYTIHVLRDGEVAGMLSVNGYTRQVFLHTWHGDFVEMSEE